MTLKFKKHYVILSTLYSLLMFVGSTYLSGSTFSVKSFVWPSPLSLEMMRRGVKTNVLHPQAQAEAGEAQADTATDALESLLTPELFFSL